MPPYVILCVRVWVEETRFRVEATIIVRVRVEALLGFGLRLQGFGLSKVALRLGLGMTLLSLG